MVKIGGQTFEINEEQHKKLRKWKNSLPKSGSATIGGAYTYEFTPTGIGTFIKVRRFDGHEIDLTTDDKF